MAIPDFQTLMLPLLKLAGDGEEHTHTEAVERLARDFRLSEQDRQELVPSGGQPRFNNRIGWTTTYLKKAGLLCAVGRGRFQVTDRGRELLATNPATIDVSFLESRFPEMVEFRSARSTEDATDGDAEATFNEAEGVWSLRPGVQQRIQQKLERSIPDDGIRRAALELLAFVIENADEERGDAWWLRETSHGLALMAGRLLACKVTRSKIRISVVGPIDEDVRTAVGAEPEDDEEFKKIPGGLLLTLPVEHAAQALRLLQDGLNAFVDLAMARVRRAVSLEDHVPEAVAYVASVVGRDLPQPEPSAEAPGTEQEDDLSEDDDAALPREPRVRGRAPIFEHSQRSIASLISDISERKVIALPDLQRPFVWEDTKVRDLLDSLFLGFPVGTLVLWHTSDDKEARAIGAEKANLRATTLVIDGQQRLTSLSAVVGGEEVVGKDGAKRKITIAFRPRDGRFEVADAAIRNDPEFLPNVTELWKGPRPKFQIKRDLMNALRDKGRAIDDRYEDAVERNFERAHAIADYRFPTVDIRKTAATPEGEATEEDVAEIFVRINNQGTRLGQADFVLTLLSVFHGELRDRIEERAREMSRESVIAVDTQQLLRAACAVAFGRARMSAVYRYLRGVDASTGEADAAGRARRLEELDAAAKECVESTPWRDYLLRVSHAGFVNQALVASKNAIVNAYALYIRGRRAGVQKHKLDELIARWIFGTLLTARYSGSSETIFEQDLARVGRLADNDANSFVRALDDTMSETITGDYWTRTLVAALETQKARSPAALAFRAAQVVLGARALFSDQLLQNLLDPPAHGARAAREAHHLFPEAWLLARGIRERRRINQVANLADVGWYENSVIGGRGPGDYVPRVRERLGLVDDDRWGGMCAEHALPIGWESMDYETFLSERRRRMAEVIRVAFRKLGGEQDAQPVNPPWFLPGAEIVWQRIAETERALRGLVREVYASAFGDKAAEAIEGALPEPERQVLQRALRARPAGADPLSIVDYLYLAQLPPLLFTARAWPLAKQRFGAQAEPKQRLQTAISQIAPVRNEIAHVREVHPERLAEANVACNGVLSMLRSGPAHTGT
jgi:hypothetical protein